MLLAGGSGSRLWPLSRAAYPKQFLSFEQEDSMLQATVNRLADLPTIKPVTICNEEHRFFVAEQLKEIGQFGSIILEPVGRNTAPAIALAALVAEDDPLLLVLAADHMIVDREKFTESVLSAIPIAEKGDLVTFGIRPDSPHTGYGYIQLGKKDGSAYGVDQFIEKPSADKARTYLDSGDYLWNSGMFLFKASRYLQELEIHCPQILESCKAAISKSKADLDFLRVDSKAFQECQSESIDYAVMEKTDHAAVVPMDAGWSDIGSWSSLWENCKKDDLGNVVRGDVLAKDCQNSLFRADGALIAAVGVKDLVVVSTKDALLVADKQNVQDVKNVVQHLKKARRSEWEHHREVYRPWGKYDSIDQGSRYQVKRITVKPGAKLSVQMHHHRAEHWIVVSGTARVTKGSEEFLLSENESTYIPVGEVHALENPGKVNLELIEVQSGSYLGEDDIVRFEDIYGRESN